MIELFGFFIEFTDEYLLTQGPLSAFWFFLKNGFWVIFVFILGWGFYKIGSITAKAVSGQMEIVLRR